MAADLPGFHFTDDARELVSLSALVVHVPFGLRAKRNLLGEFAKSLRFPAYFGWNWDALEECLRDLSWLPEARKIVVLHRDVPFSPQGPSRPIYLELLRDCVASWAAEGGRDLQVVFPAASKDPVASCLQRGGS